MTVSQSFIDPEFVCHEDCRQAHLWDGPISDPGPAQPWDNLGGTPRPPGWVQGVGVGITGTNGSFQWPNPANTSTGEVSIQFGEHLSDYSSLHSEATLFAPDAPTFNNTAAFRLLGFETTFTGDPNVFGQGTELALRQGGTRIYFDPFYGSTTVDIRYELDWPITTRAGEMRWYVNNSFKLARHVDITPIPSCVFIPNWQVLNASIGLQPSITNWIITRS